MFLKIINLGRTSFEKYSIIDNNFIKKDIKLDLDEESSSIYISNSLLNMGYKLNIYDPKVTDERILDDLNNLNKSSNNSSNTLKLDKLQIHNSLYESIKETDVILILTEWDEFKNFESEAKIIDTRNIYNGNKYFKL